MSSVRTDLPAGAELAWAAFQTRLRSYVASRVDPAWADDVVGDILLRLVEHQDSLQRADNPLAWSYKVAANVITDHHRRRAAENRSLQWVATETEISAAAADHNETEILQRELAQCLLPFVLDLPSKYAEALILTALQGHSQTDAAALVGLSPSGMKSRVQRARTLLKQRLLKCCAFELDRYGQVTDIQPHNPSPGCGCAPHSTASPN